MLIAPLRRTLRTLRHDRRGNMLMIFAFAIMPITFATGMGIDYAGAMRLQTRLNTVTDAAALSAITAPMMKEGMDDACVAARATFESQVAQVKGLIIDTKQASGLTITITDSYANDSPVTVTCPTTGVPNVPATLPLTRTATVTYAARSVNGFASILGKETLGIGGTAQTKTSVAPYIDIHLALDTSQSMGLAASDADASKMWDKTIEINGPNNGCTFGCHAFQKADSGYNSGKKANDTIASENGIRLRIDVLRDAAEDMIQTAKDYQGVNEYYQFGLYRVGASASVISDLSKELTSVKNTVHNLTLGENSSNGTGDSNLNDTLHLVNAEVKGNGDGTTRPKAKEFFFLVTDGVIDLFRMNSYTINGNTYNCSIALWDHCTAPIDSATCTLLKNKKVTVGIVYATYLPVRAKPTVAGDTALRDEYTKLVKPFASQIAAQLKACSSDPMKWYFEASDGTAIHSAMQTLFRQAMQEPAIIR